MADKGFGIRQLNLIGASGTPKIESPNNLNLNAVTVAISTDVTIGGQVTSNIIVGTGKSVGIGTTLPTNTLTVVGSGTSTSQLFVTGVSTFNNTLTVVGSGTSTSQLFVTGVSTFNNTVRVNSGSVGGIGVNFPNTQRAGFGDSSELTIFSTGTYLGNSSNYIDATSGYLDIRTLKTTIRNAEIYTQRNLAIFDSTTFDSEFVKLYYGGNEKFATIGTGVTITGTTFTNQLNVSGVSTFAGITTVTGPTLFAKQLNVSGVVTASSFVGDGSLLTNLPGGGGGIAGINTSGTSTFTNLNVTGVTTSTGGFVGNVTGNATGLSGTPNITVGTISATTTTATSFRSTTTVGDGTDIGFAIKYYITESSGKYRLAGPGVLNSTDNPTLYLHRGFTYIFENSTGGGHPFAIRTSNGGSAYTSAFLSGSQSGTQIFTVPFDAPNTLVYQCTIHAGMVGTLNIVT